MNQFLTPEFLPCIYIYSTKSVVNIKFDNLFETVSVTVKKHEHEWKCRSVHPASAYWLWIRQYSPFPLESVCLLSMGAPGLARHFCSYLLGFILTRINKVWSQSSWLSYIFYDFTGRNVNWWNKSMKREPWLLWKLSHILWKGEIKITPLPPPRKINNKTCHCINCALRI